MFLNADVLNGEVLEADICIIGGGVAGIAIATKFIASDKKIILLESGTFEPEAQTQDLYRGNSTGQIYDMMATRLRWFGGTSNHWEGMCMPLSPIDFKPRDWVPLSGWPITYEEMQPHYKKASEILKLGDEPQAIPTFDSPDNILEVKHWRFAKRLQFGETYKEELRHAKNIQVILQANVTNLKSNNNVSAIEYVEAKSLAGAYFKVKAKKYILACGGIENARILLYSNDVIPQGIGNQNDMVGRYFMEHPHHHAATFYSFGKPEFLGAFHENIRWSQPIKTKQLPDVMYAIAPTAGAQEKHKILNVSATISGQKADIKSDDPVLAYMQALAQKEELSLYASDIFVRAEQSPNPESRVMLDVNDKDALGLPRAQLQWKLKELDWQSMRTMMSVIASHLPPHQGVLRLQDWLRQGAMPPRYIGWGSHHMGTTRMGDDPKTSVVDKNCKVHGMDNLYVAGSSVFPTSGFANPTMTIVAMGVRLQI